MPFDGDPDSIKGEIKPDKLPVIDDAPDFDETTYAALLKHEFTRPGGPVEVHVPDYEPFWKVYSKPEPELENVETKTVAVDAVGGVLLRARKLISNPRKWCKGAMQRDGAYCMLGAIAAVAAREYAGAHHEALSAVGARTPGHSIANFNDAPATTHAQVMAIFDAAIKSRRILPSSMRPSSRI